MRDGLTLQYGRGDDPNAPPYLYRRDVDYCSGALLMTRRELFLDLGGLDTAYSPAYYEDPDYCVRLWRAGWRVVYLPEFAMLHYEWASSDSLSSLPRLIQRNKLYFAQKHADWLCWQPELERRSLARMHNSHDDRCRVLFPANERTPGLVAVIRRLASLHCFVTLYLLDADLGWSREELPDLPADVEVLPGVRLDTLAPFLAARRHDYDCVLAGDPEVAAHVRRGLVAARSA